MNRRIRNGALTGTLQTYYKYLLFENGEVAEWLKAAASKAVEVVSASVSSNLTLSAMAPRRFALKRMDVSGMPAGDGSPCRAVRLRRFFGEMSELVEGARLEIVCAAKSGTEGSNPSLSAIFLCPERLLGKPGKRFMSYLVLARKYRPQCFDEVVGQDHVTRTLSNAISSNRVAHAILFSGPRGTGKTTVARILAKTMNCTEGPSPVPCNQCRSCREIRSGNSVDVHEIDGASNNSVDQIRDLRENIRYTPVHSRYKIYVIDEVHMLSIAAFNALLKTLEEPPPHILFMFATTEPHKIPVTILSRCQRHEFRRIDMEAIQQQMEKICTQEGFQLPDDSLWTIAREAGGSMRDALSLLDLVISCAKGAAPSPEQVIDLLGVVDRKVIFDIAGAALDADIPSVLDLLDTVYARGYDMKKLYADLVEHFRDMLVIQMGKRITHLVDLPAHEIERIKERVNGVSSTFLHQLFSMLLAEEAALRFSSHPKMILEMAFLRMCRTKPALSMDRLIEKLDALRDAVSGAPAARDPVVQPTASAARDTDPAETVDASETAEAESMSTLHGAGDSPDRLWEKVLAITSEKYPLLAATLAKCALNTLDGQDAEILVNGNEFNLNMLKRKKSQEILKKLFSDLLGRPMRIRLISGTEIGRESQEKKKLSHQLKQEALSHPLVADTVEIFNGRVVDIKIL